MSVERTKAELRNEHEFDHIEEEINIRIQDRNRGKTNVFDIKCHLSILNYVRSPPTIGAMILLYY